MHRNTFINSPKLLHPTYQMKGRERLFFAGQMTGVEGYVESAASGMIAGMNAARAALGEDGLIFPQDTVLGSMPAYITSADPEHFQPMNANFGLLPKLETRFRSKKEKNERLAYRALDSLAAYAADKGLAYTEPEVVEPQLTEAESPAQ
jgi:methylenetetrahydrofolate--tRNA-(uracil-5-)-methyltransferase